MKIIIEAEPKEIAALVSNVREPQNVDSIVEKVLKELSSAFCHKDEARP